MPFTYPTLSVILVASLITGMHDMPRAQDATTWSPQLKRKAPTAEGPVIWTREGRRDGSRPVDVVPEPGVIDWGARLAKTGTGTPDPSFNPQTDITYAGAFLIPHWSSLLTNRRSIVFKTAEPGGRNGPNGSLFIGGKEGVDLEVAELQIPDWSDTVSETDYLQLPQTTVLQDWTVIGELAPVPDANSKPINFVGAMNFVGDRLFVAGYNDYDGDAQNSYNLLICNDAKDMANSTYQGFLSRDFEDRGSVYAFSIPPEHQTKFGGHTHMTGAWNSMSIVGRSSAGPAMLGWTPESIAAADTHVTAVQYTHYSDSNPIDWYTNNGLSLIEHYESQLGVASLASYLNSDPATRVSDPDTLPLPDISLHPGSSHDTEVRCAFIPPGSDTVVFIGNNIGMRYGSLYKEHSWEQGNTAGTSAGWAPTSMLDHFNVIWTLNINDAANAVNPSDPHLIQQSLFDDQRWRGSYGFRVGRSAVRGSVVGGSFDPSTGLLYLMQVALERNQFTTHSVVSVYQVGGGA